MADGSLRRPPREAPEVLSDKPSLFRRKPLQLVPGRQPDPAVATHELGAERGWKPKRAGFGALALPLLLLVLFLALKGAAGVEHPPEQPLLPGDHLAIQPAPLQRTGQVAGFYPDTIPWMYERLPAFLGHDFNIDWNPRPGWEGLRNPIHVAVLNWIGINIVENLDLEAAVTTARRLNRYEFVITFAPLPVEGGTGSPVNPLAIF